MQILADKLEQREKGDQSRAAIVGAIKKKRKASRTKKAKRKYRKLEEEKERKRLEEMGVGEGVEGVEKGVVEEGEVASTGHQRDGTAQSALKATPDRKE